MGPIQLDRRWHLIQETDATENLREGIDEPDLVTWFNKRVGTFCIGIWRNRDRGIVQELPLVFPHPSALSRKNIETLRYVCSPWATRELIAASKELKQEDRRASWAYMDRTAQKDDLLKSFRRSNERRWGATRAERIDRFYRRIFGIGMYKE